MASAISAALASGTAMLDIGRKTATRCAKNPAGGTRHIANMPAVPDRRGLERYGPRSCAHMAMPALAVEKLRMSF